MGVSHSKAAFLACGAVLAAIVALSAFTRVGGQQPTRSDEDRAAVESAADRLTHAQVAAAWTQMKLGNGRPMQPILQSFPLPHRTTYQDGDGIVLVFQGHGDTCIDVVTRPQESIVSARHC